MLTCCSFTHVPLLSVTFSVIPPAFVVHSHTASTRTIIWLILAPVSVQHWPPISPFIHAYRLQ